MAAGYDFVLDAPDDQNRADNFTNSVDGWVEDSLDKSFERANIGHKLINHVRNGGESVFQDDSTHITRDGKLSGNSASKRSTEDVESIIIDIVATLSPFKDGLSIKLEAFF